MLHVSAAMHYYYIGVCFSLLPPILPLFVCVAEEDKEGGGDDDWVGCSTGG